MNKVLESALTIVDKISKIASAGGGIVEFFKGDDIKEEKIEEAIKKYKETHHK